MCAMDACSKHACHCQPPYIYIYRLDYSRSSSFVQLASLHRTHMIMRMRSMAQRIGEVLSFIVLALLCKANSAMPSWWASLPHDNASYCLSWRLAVEANNVRAWRTVPIQCLGYIETYMIWGQYFRDLDFIMDQILSYANEIIPSADGMDAWILDVDDTCISNVIFYGGKRYGCDPFDPAGFKAWATRGGCPAIPAALRLFKRLVDDGFKVILLTGRDDETLSEATIDNLHKEGFIGYERLILRSAAYKGQSAVQYKSEIRKQLVEQGYRIWGNVGDQWSDLQGEYLGNRTFKLPNPMYFVP